MTPRLLALGIFGLVTWFASTASVAAPASARWRGSAAPVAAQQDASDVSAAEWNAPAVVDLIRLGIERRSTQVHDTSLITYSARGNGYVYFLLDASDVGRQSLVRTDQVAVDIHWRAPDQIRQRIVGLREEYELPVRNLHYYLDRLTVVHDNFGDAIVIADGDNVHDVPHPVGPHAEDVYDFRLGDALILQLAGLTKPVRVQEVLVRPKDPANSAVIGSVFLETETGAVVRMTLTFTPSSYVDPRLDYINVTLENGLWEGRYWLPHEQSLEIRREMPELELPFGTLIRTRMRVGDYRFNEPVPEALFISRARITLAPEEERRNFPFDREVDADWEYEGIGQPVPIDEIQRTARAIARDQVLTGLPGGRLWVGAASDLLRYNRAEGFALGIGVSTRPSSDLSLRLLGGWAFGARHPLGRVELVGARPGLPRVGAYVNRLGEVSGFEHTSGLANSLGGLLLRQDWSDPYYASGGDVGYEREIDDGWSLRARVRAERQRSARLTTTYSLFNEAGAIRPVRSIDSGSHFSATMGLARGAPEAFDGWWGEATLTAGGLNGDDESFGFGRSEITAGTLWTGLRYRARVQLTGRAGLAFGDLPRQELYLLGGRGTLPGYDHKSLPADRFALVSFLGSGDLVFPWIRGRVFGGVGWTDLGGPGKRAATDFFRSPGSPTTSPTFPGTGRVLPSVGIGVGFFFDLLQVDLARGLGRNGRWQVIVDFPTAFWDYL